MIKEFVPYNLAIELKELGFDEPCFTSYNKKGELANWFEDCEDGEVLNVFENDEYCTAPLYQQTFKFFREKYNLEGIPQRAEERAWYKFWIYELYEDCKIMISTEMQLNTYEEAELACIEKLIEIVKQNKL